MNWSEYFFENWLDKLVTLLSVIVGIVTACGIVLSKVLDSLKGLRNAQDIIQKQNADTTQTHQQLQELAAKLLVVLHVLQNTNELNNDILKHFDEIGLNLSTSLDDLKHALAIALLNDELLINNGFGNQLTQLLGGDNNVKIDKK